MELPKNNNEIAFKCYNCGKQFKYDRDYQRHKDRVTPCLIREVAVADRNNPNRCIYCNKIFLNKSNLNKHSKTCKIKNGGIEILADKVRHEQELRILREQMEIQKHEIEQKIEQTIEQKMEQKDEQIKEIMEQNKILKERLEKMEQNQVMVAVPGAINTGTINNITNNTNNNHNIQINNNLTINNFRKPSIEGIRLEPEDLESGDIFGSLLARVYFNSKHPQNHSLFLLNKKVGERSVLVKDEEWKILLDDAVKDLLTQVNNQVFALGDNFVNGKNGPYKGADEHFLKLPEAHQRAIIAYNQYEGGGLERVLEIMLNGRDVVRDTIKKETDLL